MPSIRIIDASVAIKWFIVEESKRGEALILLDEIQSSPHNFAVPELFFNEMLAVFCRLDDNATKIKRYLYLLENLGFHRLGNGSDLLSTAVQLAVRHRLTGYDAIYLACANVMKGVWVTADAKAHKRVAHLKISQLL